MTKASLLQDLDNLKIAPHGTLLVHSSMKSIGDVEGGPDTVLDALSEYMKDGLLVLPTHTWASINQDNPEFHVSESPSCVGILTEVFRKRPGIWRSLHPTHSVAALGSDAEEFVSGDEKFDTPCARGSVWGKLLDRRAVIMLIGVDLTRNTFIHGIEEWMNVPGRVSDEPRQLYAVTPDGTRIHAPVRGHTAPVWNHYSKVDGLLEAKGAMRKGRFGDAEVRLCDTARTTELLSAMLRMEPDLFLDDTPIDPQTFPGLL
ncbi:AAC(3) family N-acetyltransferase [Paenibacillus contaminans]|uniref:Aminoglycoside N(3)-acetyltransferase n=1 Tax=Paenibacillus contaminans TaxID=450362 RepID=A0A329MRI9_9BACL|nr:AAC(3) family N-acetyltransferase [Paenibacillus contaminans]RAV22589.1 aminoglycoside N(3)-acetyltransferase [Paenibacillus contaminans]